MAENTDPDFFKRADSFIDVANQHCATTERSRVCASFMYALARFNTWLCAAASRSGEEMQEGKAERVEHFVQQYRLMLEEHMDDYIKNFPSYMSPKQ